MEQARINVWTLCVPFCCLLAIYVRREANVIVETEENFTYLFDKAVNVLVDYLQK